jgi:hypothetical protein
LAAGQLTPIHLDHRYCANCSPFCIPRRISRSARRGTAGYSAGAPRGRIQGESHAAVIACICRRLCDDRRNGRISPGPRREWVVDRQDAERGLAFAAFRILNEGACVSSSACVAVGSGVNDRANRIAIATSWNGTPWSAQYIPQVRGAAGAALAAVSCVATDDCTAVGFQLSGAALAFPLVERWDGSAWHLEPSPAGRGGSLGGVPASALNGQLASVACATPISCVAVSAGGGHAHQPMADLWNGIGWASESIDRPARAPSSYLDAVSCAGPASCTAVGWFTGAAQTRTAMAESWNGTSWALQSSADVAGAVLTSVSCVTSSACTAVGATDNGATAAVWNGSVWSMQPTPNHAATARQLQAVICSSSVSCTAVGSAVGTAGYQVTLAELYTG